MKRCETTAMLGLVLLSLMMAASGCCGISASRSLLDRSRTDEVDIQAQGARSVQVKITMGAGELAVAGGASDLMEGTFAHNQIGRNPEIRYNVSEGQGSLVISQTTQQLGLGSSATQNRWQVYLTRDIPLDMQITLGAGQSNLDLSDLDLIGAHVVTGAGETRINLAGNWKREIYVLIQAGVGETTVQLPSEMGAIVDVRGGLGNVSARGLDRKGDAYVNEAYGRSPTTLHVSIEAGIGDVSLQVAD